jgi:hypothetical protein
MSALAFKKRRSDIVEIIGTGNASVDTANLQSAVATANANNKPVIFHVSGSVYVNAAVTITAPVSWTFAAGGELVRATTTAYIIYNSVTPPWDAGTSYDITATAVGDSVLISPNLALDVGDHVAIWAQNEVTTPDFTPHSSDDKFVPAEIHRIARVVTGDATRYVTNDRCDDACTTYPRIRKLTMTSGVRISGMKCRALPGAFSDGSFLIFGYCADLELRNCSFGPLAPGPVAFFCCYDVRRIGLTFSDVENPNTNLMTTNGGAYGILDQVVTRAQLLDSTFGTVRHGYTTGAAYRRWGSGIQVFAQELRSHTFTQGAVTYHRIYRANSAGASGTTAPTHASGNASDGSITWTYVSTGRYRSGTVRDFRVAGCMAGNNGVQTASATQQVPNGTWSGLSPFDTHSEAIRGVFENNQLRMPNETGNIGFTMRGRNIVVANNTVYGGTQTIPVQMQSSNCTVVGNTFIGGHRCEIIDKESVNPNLKNVRFIGNRFIDFYNPGIIVYNGQDHVIDNNDFINCGFLFNNSPNIPSSALYAKASLGIRITNNRLSKYTNKLSIMWDDAATPLHMTVENNVMSGYGDWNDGTRHPMWQAGKAINRYDMVWVADREYRVSNITSNGNPVTSGTTGNTAPTTYVGSETLSNITYQFVRTLTTYNHGLAARKFMPRNGFANVSVVSITGHGLTNDERYRPINDNGTVLDNLSEPKCSMVLLDVVNDDTLIVAYSGDQVDVPLTSINGSFSMSQPVDLYWDIANLNYKTTAPQNNGADPMIRAMYQDFEKLRILVL